VATYNSPRNACIGQVAIGTVCTWEAETDTFCAIQVPRHNDIVANRFEARHRYFGEEATRTVQTGV
jgi:hypothetical protein